MSRTRTTRLRAPIQGVSGGGKEDEPKYFLTLAFSLFLCIILWLDHGPLPQSEMASSGPAGSSPVPPTPTKSTKQAAEASINRKLRKPFYSATVDRRSSLSFADFSKTYDCIKPVLISGAMKGWGAMKWSRQMFVEKYGHELMALAMTKGGLNKREVYVMPVKELNGQMANGSASSWSMSEDEMFLRMHPELQNDIGKLVSHLLHGTCHLTGSWHRCMQKTICSIASQTASVHQMSHCNGVLLIRDRHLECTHTTGRQPTCCFMVANSGSFSLQSRISTCIQTKVACYLGLLCNVDCTHLLWMPSCQTTRDILFLKKHGPMWPSREQERS